jgi:hypothetical protein
MRGNNSLILDPGNQFRASDAPPYFIFPNWWRRFIFVILSAEELRLYCCLCTYFDSHSIAYPLRKHLANETGVSEQVIVACLKRLKQLGFILSAKQLIQRTFSEPIKRTVYQRPAPEFTLLQLLSADEIDEDLYPVKYPTVDAKLSEAAVDVGLRRLLGPEKYPIYSYIADRLEKRSILRDALTKSLNRRRNGASIRAS